MGSDAAVNNPILLFLFVLANVAITAGYLFLAGAVIPKVRIRRLITRVGGIGFFVLCGITHLEMAWMAIASSDTHRYADVSVTWWMMGVHIPQAICVWLFVTGIYMELGDFAAMTTRAERAEEHRAAVALADAELEAYLAPGPEPDPPILDMATGPTGPVGTMS